ncbi:hypothetical protein [Brevundimonas sp. FT23042]
MTIKSKSRLVRLGAARSLTRAVDKAELTELNSSREYEIPSGE